MEDYLPAEQNARKRLLQQRNNPLRQKALDCLDKINPERAKNTKKLIELAACLASIDKALGEDDGLTPSKGKGNGSSNGNDFDDDDDENENHASGNGTQSSLPPKKKMFDAFIKYTREHHTFEGIPITSQFASKLTAGCKENTLSQEITNPPTIQSLKYFTSAPPKKSERKAGEKDKLGDKDKGKKKEPEKPKPLTNDQKLLNSIFNREMKKIWVSGQQMLKEKLEEYVNTGGLKSAVNVESESKSKADGEDSKLPAADAAPTLSNLSRAKIEMIVYNEVGYKQLKEWVELDEDELIEETRRLKNAQLKEAKDNYAAFVRQKDSLRIRIPDNYNIPTAPTMAFSKAMKTVRPDQGKGPQTSVEIMAGCGLKYIHATKGTDDLEKSRQYILSKGYVYKENFTQVDQYNKPYIDEDVYHSEKERNKILRNRADFEKTLKDESSKAFDEWVILKDLRDQAVEYLKHIKVNVASSTNNGNNALSAMVRSSRESISLSSTNSHNQISDEAKAECIEVGKALKKVDRSLLQDWSLWCEQVFPFNAACVLWDAFEPKACDVHSSSYSQIRSTFMKLLKPGLDYRKHFTTYARRILRRDIPVASDSKYDDDDNYDDSDKNSKKKNDLSLSKRHMGMFLKTMGINLSDQQMRVLVDAFDGDGNNKISLEEFLSFVGEKRDTHGGCSLAFNRKCCWMTTCKLTGMPNAYTESTATKRVMQSASTKGGMHSSFSEEKSESKEKEYEDSKEDDHERDLRDLGHIVIREMANGEKRMRIELKERVKREQILISYGVIDSSLGTARSKADGNYDNDFEDEDNKNNKSNSNSYAPDSSPCQFVKWALEDRKSGIMYLQKASKSIRQEELLKSMLLDGKPPQPPQLFVSKDESSSINADDELAIPLSWKPTKGTIVSFYSIECSGPTGLAKSDRYIEIYRDPKDARPDTEFKFNYNFKSWNSAPLLPGLTYSFRIRAFNGFGPGNYTYKQFTTLPLAPRKPRITKLSSASVTFRWTFSDSFIRRVNDLRKIFDVADGDKSGTVQREELAAVLDDKASNSTELRTFLRKVAADIGVDVSHGYSALFDMIENDDNNSLSWEEFEQFFMNAGWCIGNSIVMNGSVNGSIRGGNTSIAGDGGGSSSVNASVYVVEKCESEFLDVYKEILKTSSGEATISRLEPGKSYRFRVFAINAAGDIGPRSESLIVHTMLDTPAAPTPIPRSVGTRRIHLAWKPKNASTNTRDPVFIKKMLSDWAGSSTEGGVSIEKAFAKYDKDLSGYLDLAELAKLLDDLGVDVTAERVTEAMNILDVNSDNQVSFEEFSLWWKGDEVSYTIKRSEAIAPIASMRGSSNHVNISGNALEASVGLLAQDAMASKSVSMQNRVRPVTASQALMAKSSIHNSESGHHERHVAMPIVSYRGSEVKCEIAGLEPNKLYHFKLRYNGSKSNSQLSPPLSLMTAPLPSSAPILVFLGSSQVRIKWYAPQHGAYKFVVQSSQFIANGKLRPNEEWYTVYEGPDTIWICTTMVPDTKYDIRILSQNYQGACSEASPVLSFTTLPRGDVSAITSAKNADTYFTVDCTGDVCVGDTILFSERLYSKQAPTSSSAAKKQLPSSMRESTASVVSLLKGEDAQVNGVFIGERTIAAHVVRDNYRSIRDAFNAYSDNKRLGKSRILGLEVIWQRASDSCKPYELTIGSIIERTQTHLELFEVIRCAWMQERDRKALGLEWESLKDCFIAYQ